MSDNFLLSSAQVQRIDVQKNYLYGINVFAHKIVAPIALADKSKETLNTFFRPLCTYLLAISAVFHFQYGIALIAQGGMRAIPSKIAIACAACVSAASVACRQK